jgi:hypothetical protein
LFPDISKKACFFKILPFQFYFEFGKSKTGFLKGLQNQPGSRPLNVIWITSSGEPTCHPRYIAMNETFALAGAMEAHMPRNTIVTIFFAVSLTAGLAITQAQAGELGSAVKSCEASPGCSHGEPDREGGMLFKIQSEGKTKYVRCAGNGECMRIMPRGEKFLIKDITIMLAAG